MNQMRVEIERAGVHTSSFGQRQLPARLQVRVVRAVLDLVVEQIDEHREEQQVDEAEEDDRGQHRVGLDHRGQPFRRAQQAIDDPRLAPDLGGEPAGLVGDLRPEHREHQQPQQPALLEQRPAPEVKEAQPGHGNHPEADRHHDVIELERDIHRRPVFAA